MWIALFGSALAAGLVWNAVNWIGGFLGSEFVQVLMWFLLGGSLLYAWGLHQAAQIGFFEHNTDARRGLATLQMAFWTPVLGIIWAKMLIKRRGGWFRNVGVGEFLITTLVFIGLIGLMMVVASITIANSGAFRRVNYGEDFDLVMEHLIGSGAAFGYAIVSLFTAFAVCAWWRKRNQHKEDWI